MAFYYKIFTNLFCVRVIIMRNIFHALGDCVNLRTLVMKFHWTFLNHTYIHFFASKGIYWYHGEKVSLYIRKLLFQVFHQTFFGNFFYNIYIFIRLNCLCIQENTQNLSYLIPHVLRAFIIISVFTFNFMDLFSEIIERLDNRLIINLVMTLINKEIVLLIIKW